MSEEQSSDCSSNRDSQSSKTSRTTCERIFDDIYEEYQKNPQVGYEGMPPQMKPIFYATNPKESPLKWRRIATRRHEHDEREKLIKNGFNMKKADTFAKAASYYPGLATYQTLDKAISYSMTPPRISFSSSDDEASPRYLFKDLPAVTSEGWSLSPTCNTSSLNATITTLQLSPSVPPVTPERPTSSGVLPEVLKTPYRPGVSNYPSPIFDSSKFRQKKRRKIIITGPPKPVENFVDSSNISTNVNVEAERISIRERTNDLSPA